MTQTKCQPLHLGLGYSCGARKRSVGKMSRGSAPKGGKKKGASFVIDCAKPVEDKIMDISSLEKFLLERIKVARKAEALSDSITVSRDKNEITVASDNPFSKRNLASLIFLPNVVFIGFTDIGKCNIMGENEGEHLPPVIQRNANEPPTIDQRNIYGSEEGNIGEQSVPPRAIEPPLELPLNTHNEILLQPLVSIQILVEPPVFSPNAQIQILGERLLEHLAEPIVLPHNAQIQILRFFLGRTIRFLSVHLLLRVMNPQ